MKKLFSRSNIPEFLQNRRLRGIAIMTAALAILGIVLSFLLNWVFGVIVLVLVGIATLVVFNTMAEIGDDTTQYISDLSFRIQQGEQEALLRMPPGVMILGDSDRWNGSIRICRTISAIPTC